MHDSDDDDVRFPRAGSPARSQDVAFKMRESYQGLLFCIAHKRCTRLKKPPRDDRHRCLALFGTALDPKRRAHASLVHLPGPAGSGPVWSGPTLSRRHTHTTASCRFNVERSPARSSSPNWSILFPGATTAPETTTAGSGVAGLFWYLELTQQVLREYLLCRR
jgi:hypothetical protein